MGLSDVMKNLEECGLALYDSEIIDSADLVDAAELAEDYADISISELMDALTKSTDIPVVGTLAAAAKTAGTFHDAYLIWKWLIFQKLFRKGSVPPEKLRKWKEAAKNHEKWIQREIELLLVRIDNISEKRNVEILCNVYLEYLNGECTEDQFHEAAVLLERFVSYDEKQLKAFYDDYLLEQKEEAGTIAMIKIENFHCDRLVALGLIWVQYRPMPGSSQPLYHITEIGTVLGRAL